jgi:Domain of unknown function (DUF4258)
MRQRGLDRKVVRSVLEAPEQRLRLRPGRDVLRSRVAVAGSEYVVRMVVDVDRSPAEVVTVYRTSRIARYWRTEP